MSALPAAHAQALRRVAAALAETDIVWALTGSASFALQGMALTPNDLDLQTDADGAYAIAHRFADCVTRPVAFSEAEQVRSHFGALRIEGIKVEIMGDMETRLPDGTWGGSQDWAEHITAVPLDDLRIPALSLDYEYHAYLRLGRAERAAAIKAFLESR